MKVIEVLQQELTCMRLQLQELNERASKERQEARSDLLAMREETKRREEDFKRREEDSKRREEAAANETRQLRQTWDSTYRAIRTAAELSDLEGVLGVGRRTSRYRLVMELAAGTGTMTVYGRVREVCDRNNITSRLVTQTVELRIEDVDPLAAGKDVAEALLRMLKETVPETE
uniref:Uncharacterized protein n=1 Tax=Anopheles maculatus TaxID=74869 RepID=A0A182S9J7_9DIPT